MERPAPLTVEEVAGELCCSVDDVRALIREGELQTVACGVRPGLVPRHRLDDYRRRHRFDHGHEPRAEEIVLHQRYLTLAGQVKAAAAERDETELRRLRPLLEKAHKRWIAANLRVTRGD